MDILQTMKLRKSTRKYKSEQISDSDLNYILEAGYCAPVGMAAYKNIRITVVQNNEILNRISNGTKTAFNNQNFEPLHNAPTLIIVSAEDAKYPQAEIQDCACIVENMHLMATGLGLGSCYIVSFANAFKVDLDLISDLEIPENHKIISGLVVGHSESAIDTLKDVTDKIATKIVK